MKLIDKNQILYMIDNIDRVVALKNEIDDIPIIEAIPISFIEKQIEERREQEQWELDTYGEYNQMGWVYSHLIDEWRKENETNNI